MRISPEERQRSIGKRLRELRDTAGLSQAELATKVGKEIETIKLFENSEQPISATELWDLCEALDTKPHQFFEDGA